MTEMALENIRVLDLSRLLPGAYCTQILADFGAEVVKIEQPEVGDYERWFEPKVGEYSALFASINRNKKSITLNLKNEEEVDILLDLVRDADVLVESFRPGVMKRLGIDYETLKQINPGLVYCAITGYGQTGPYKTKPGHDINFLSYTSLLSFQGEKDEKPTIPATQIADLGGGSMMAISGILIALMNKMTSGEGQFVDISMTDSMVSWLQTLLPSYLAGQEMKQGELELAGRNANYAIYKTADNRYLSVSALQPKFWEAFCEGIGRTDLIPKLNAPLETQIKMKKEIEQITQKKSLDSWLHTFHDLEDACVSPILNLEEMLQDPQIKERDLIVEKDNQSHIRVPIKLSKTPARIRAVAPNLGEHNEEILMNFK